MRQPLRKFRKLTKGECGRALAFALVGACSAGLGYLAVLHLDQNAFLDEMSWYQTWVVVASGLGGLSALRGLAGAIWVTFIGSLIGGTLSLPFYGTMFGPFIVTVTLLGVPLLAILWAFNLFGVHVLMGIYQRERDSIFMPSKMTIRDHPNSLRPRMQGRFS